VLPVHVDFGANSERPNEWWACSGGGIESNETVAGGPRRELREELGLEATDIGQPIWRKEQVFPMNVQVAVKQMPRTNKRRLGFETPLSQHSARLTVVLSGSEIGEPSRLE
jgi:8-oxo-dGTP pyrophosphatase MutT (NUDIX family)